MALVYQEQYLLLTILSHRLRLPQGAKEELLQHISRLRATGEWVGGVGRSGMGQAICLPATAFPGGGGEGGREGKFDLH